LKRPSYLVNILWNNKYWEESSSSSRVTHNTGGKRPCSVYTRFTGKIPQTLRGEDDFST